MLRSLTLTTFERDLVRTSLRVTIARIEADYRKAARRSTKERCVQKLDAVHNILHRNNMLDTTVDFEL